MKLERFSSALLKGMNDISTLRRVGEMLGDELPRNRIVILNEARAMIARKSFPAKSYEAGYALAILDLLVAYVAVINQNEYWTVQNYVAEGW